MFSIMWSATETMNESPTPTATIHYRLNEIQKNLMKFGYAPVKFLRISKPVNFIIDA